MKLGDITILSSDLPPFEVMKKPSPLTLSFLSSIIHSSHFNEEMERFYEETASFYPNFKSEGLYSKFAFELYKQCKPDLEFIVQFYDLPSIFTYQFFILFCFHLFIDLSLYEDLALEFVPTPSDLSEIVKCAEQDEENVSAIVLNSKVTKKALHDFIDNNWKEIDNGMEQYLPIFPRLDKFTNIGVSDDIYTLHKEGKTIKEIADILCEKYPDDDYFLDEGWIKNKLSRYKKRTKNYAQKKLSKAGRIISLPTAVILHE